MFYLTYEELTRDAFLDQAFLNEMFYLTYEELTQITPVFFNIFHQVFYLTYEELTLSGSTGAGAGFSGSTGGFTLPMRN